MGSSDKFYAWIGIAPCCFVSYETFWVPEYSLWTAVLSLWDLQSPGGTSKKLLFPPCPMLYPRHPQVTLAAQLVGATWESLLREASCTRFLEVSSEKVKKQQ